LVVAAVVGRGRLIGRLAQAETRHRRRRPSSALLGAKTAFSFYSLIESAKLAGVEPRAYLLEATLRAVRNPGTATLARDVK
jgi:hypothetical protein